MTGSTSGRELVDAFGNAVGPMSATPVANRSSTPVPTPPATPQDTPTAPAGAERPAETPAEAPAAAEVALPATGTRTNPAVIGAILLLLGAIVSPFARRRHA